MRPHPVVVARLELSFRDRASPLYNHDKDKQDKTIQLLNIGDSSSFDVEVEDLVAPQILIAQPEITRLHTERLLYLQPQKEESGTHTIEPSGGILATLDPACQLVNQLSEAFHAQHANPNLKHDDYRYGIKFFVSYRALHGRQFKQRYRLVVHLGEKRAWIEQGIKSRPLISLWRGWRKSPVWGSLPATTFSKSSRFTSAESPIFWEPSPCQ
jgi:hypothetical protein